RDVDRDVLPFGRRFLRRRDLRHDLRFEARGPARQAAALGDRKTRQRCASEPRAGEASPRCCARRFPECLRARAERRLLVGGGDNRDPVLPLLGAERGAAPHVDRARSRGHGGGGAPRAGPGGGGGSRGGRRARPVGKGGGGPASPPLPAPPPLGPPPPTPPRPRGPADVAAALTATTTALQSEIGKWRHPGNATV